MRHRPHRTAASAIVLHCPHCAAPVTHSDLLARRFLRERTCRACGGGYFEGGATVVMAIVAAGGAVATTLRDEAALPEWAPFAIAFGGALIGIAYTHRCPPRKIDEFRSTLLSILLLVPLVALAVWAFLEVIPR